MDRSMPSFHNAAVEIAYLDAGEGEPIVLVHGFASTRSVNWVYPTWAAEVVRRLEATSPDVVKNPVGRTFRASAVQTRSDRLGLAACLRGARGLMSRAEVARIALPVLIAVGTTDEIAGSAERLGQIIA